MQRLIIAGIGVLAVALLAAGCGGGGTDEATAQVSKAEFFTQAKWICTKRQEEFWKEIKTSKNLSDAYEQLGPILKREAEELQAISGPEQVEKEVKPLIAHVVRASRLAEQQGEAAGTAPSTEAYKKEAAELKLSQC